MKACYCLLTCLNIPPAVICSLTYHYLWKDVQFNSPVWYFTLVCAALLFVLPLGLSIFYCRELKIHNKMCTRFHWCPGLVGVTSAALGVVGIVMLLLYADEFPPLSSYGGFTFFYILFFALCLFPILLYALSKCLDLEKINRGLFLRFFLFTVGTMFWLFFGTHHEYKNYSSLSYSVVMGHIAALLALNSSYLVYALRKKNDQSKCTLCYLLFYETSSGLFFPLVPFSLVLEFVLSMLRDNLF